LSQIKRAIPFLMAFAIAGAVFANGLGGERLEKVVGDRIVDVGTDQEGTPVAGEPIEFDFNLLNSETREPLTYVTSVGIDIGHDGKSMVNCDLEPELPMTFLFYTFPEAGNYTLKVTFFDKNRDRQDVATAIFPLTISASAGKKRLLYITALMAGILLGLLVVYWVARKRRARVLGGTLLLFG
jgi:hypothetical protein